jgi:hypothetical protein
MIDETATNFAIKHSGLAECLHVPVGAVDEVAISTYVGEVQRVLNGGGQEPAPGAWPASRW